MIKTTEWNGKELHVIEWEVNGKLEWCFFGSEIVSLLEYKDNYTKVLLGNTKTNKAKVRNKNRIKVKKKELELNMGESPKLNIGRQGDILVTEMGAYELIMKSDMPLAEEFQDWVFNLLKQLREKAGLEQYEAFRMLDKQVQKKVNVIINEVGDLDKTNGLNNIVGNKNVNKIVSEFFGFDTVLNKNEMETFCKEMLIDRQEILQRYADNLIVSDGSHRQATTLTRKWFTYKYKDLLEENNINI